MPEKRILVLCTGNSARSQMAEAILKKYAGHRYAVFSAGLDPKEINPYTLRVLSDNGYETSGLRSKGVGEFLGKTSFDYVIFVCSRAEKNCPVTFPGTLSLSRLSWPFEDPAAFVGTDSARMEKFRQIFGKIETKVMAWLKDESDASVPKLNPTQT